MGRLGIGQSINLGTLHFSRGNIVSWRSKKQPVVARSSAEAELRAMALVVCEPLWVKIILGDLGIDWKGTIKLYCDNKSTINIAHNPVQHDRTKHVEIDRHFIKEKLESGLLCMPYVPSKEQLADVLTKGLSSTSLQGILKKLGMKDNFTPSLRGSVGRNLPSDRES